MKDSVCHGSKERQRSGRDGTVKLKACQSNVGRERSVNRDLELQVIRACLLLCLCSAILNRLEHALDILILVLVKLLYLPCLVCILCEIYGPATIALSRSVGRDKLELALVLVG